MKIIYESTVYHLVEDLAALLAAIASAPSTVTGDLVDNTDPANPVIGLTGTHFLTGNGVINLAGHGFQMAAGQFILLSSQNNKLIGLDDNDDISVLQYDNDNKLEITSTGTLVKGNLKLTDERAGNADLVGGTVTVTNSTVTVDTLILLTRKTAGGVIGGLTYTLNAGSDFTIDSDNILDTSTVTYILIELISGA